MVPRVFHILLFFGVGNCYFGYSCSMGQRMADIFFRFFGPHFHCVFWQKTISRFRKLHTWASFAQVRLTGKCDTPLDSSRKDEKNEYNIDIRPIMTKIFKFLLFAKKNVLKYGLFDQNVSSKFFSWNLSVNWKITLDYYYSGLMAYCIQINVINLFISAYTLFNIYDHISNIASITFQVKNYR